jgi:hypothetical protein
MIGGGASQPAMKDYLQETVLDPYNRQMAATGGIKMYFLPNTFV